MRGAKDAALNAIAEEKVEADERIAELERQLTEEREAHEAASRERDRLQGECGRLQGELRKRDDNAPANAPDESAPVVQAEPTKPVRGILATPARVAEVFPGEVREQVVATLLGAAKAYPEGRDITLQGNRDRREAVSLRSGCRLRVATVCSQEVKT